MIKSTINLLGLVIALLVPIAHVSAEEEIYTLERLQHESWFVSEPKSVEEVEADSLNEMRKAKENRSDLPLVPFGVQNEAWLGFKKLLNDGEMLYFISAPEKDWKRLRGTSGYAIFRDGRVAYYFRTMVN